MSKIISFSHQKGGVGKSTLAFNIAQRLSKDARVCVVDLDKQGSLSQISELVEFDILDNVKVGKLRSLNYDFILVDTPPYLSENLIELFIISDLIVIPTRAGILDLFAIKGTINLIKDAGQEKKAMIVFNLIKPNTRLTSDVLKEMQEFDLKIADTHISDLVAFTRSVLLGGVDSDNAQSQIDSITSEILNQII